MGHRIVWILFGTLFVVLFVVAVVLPLKQYNELSECTIDVVSDATPEQMVDNYSVLVSGSIDVPGFCYANAIGSFELLMARNPESVAVVLSQPDNYGLSSFAYDHLVVLTKNLFGENQTFRETFELHKDQLPSSLVSNLAIS